MASNNVTRKALKAGRDQAAEVLKFRETQLRRRDRAIKQAPAKLKARAPAAAIAPKFVRLLGRPGSLGVIIAEGDSWFDYPLHDILQLLEDHHGYEVESVAHKGDRVEEMAYGLGQLEEFTRRVEKLLRRNIVPRAILLSGGGNDIAGAELSMLINHAQSPIAGINQKVLDGVIGDRIRIAYITILSALTRLCEQRLGRPIPVLIHGYDYPVPDGRGFLGGWWFFPGPWLEPGFREKGFDDIKTRIALAKDLIDQFNKMLESVAKLPAFKHVHYIDLRKTLSGDKNYKRDWANELHPTARGFQLITDRFANVLAKLP